MDGLNSVLYDLLIFILNFVCGFCTFPFYKKGAEYKSGKGTHNNKLQRQCHDKIFAVGCKVVGNGIAGKTVSVIDPKYTCKSNLPDYGKYLYCKNDENRSVSRLDNTEGA